jgi:anaerobic magnesium-protoporphyrin IX monomethyl ester cyclase
MKILITHTNIINNDPKQKQKMQPYPPLATIQAAAILREAGFDVLFFDPTFHKNLKGFESVIRSFRPDVLLVYEDYFNFITKMCLLHMRETAQLMCKAASDSGAVTIVASPDTSDHPEEFLKEGIDYVLIGEADETVRELCLVLERGSDRSQTDVAGIAYRLPDGNIKKTAPRPLLRDLDTLPMPAWDLVEVEAYSKAWKNHHGFSSLNLVASRGCPFSCNWCAKPIWGKHYVQRSVKQVVEELKWIIQNIGPDHIWFSDDIFGLSESWLVDFDAALSADNIYIDYTIQSRADLLSPKAISALNNSGCAEIWLGAESGSQKILDAMEKGIKVEDLKNAVRDLKTTGIKTGLFFQFGYPGETLEDILASADLIRETLPEKIGVSVSYPLPGTPFFESVKKYMQEKTNWEDSNDLAMLFQGAYATPFYRKLHQVLHDELDLRHQISSKENTQSPEIQVLWKKVMEGWMTLGMMEETNQRGGY